MAMEAEDPKTKQALDMAKVMPRKDQRTEDRRKAKLQAQRNFLAGVGAQKDVED